MRFGFRTVLLAVIAASLTLDVAFAAEPRVVAVIDIPTQTVTVSVDGVARYTWEVSTAAPGRVTPTGTFTPFWLHANHYSSLYNNAPMPFSVFFNGNIAMHGTTDIENLGTPQSHGCVRLDPANAEIFFNLVQTYGMEATRVIVQ